MTMSNDLFLQASTPVAAQCREVFQSEAQSLLLRGNSPLAEAVRAVLNPAPELPVIRVVSTENVTGRWLSANAGRVYPALRSHINAVMRRSGGLGLVDEHVQTFLLRLVEDDRLAPVLNNGEEVKVSVLRMWAYHSAVRDARSWGADAATRTSRYAKTSREVSRGPTFRVVQSPDAARVVITSTEDGGSSSDYTDPQTLSPEDVAVRRSRIQHVRAVLARRGHGHLIPVVDGLLDGKTIQELAGAYGMSVDTIRSTLSGMRDLQAA